VHNRNTSNALPTTSTDHIQLTAGHYSSIALTLCFATVPMQA